MTNTGRPVIYPTEQNRVMQFCWRFSALSDETGVQGLDKRDESPFVPVAWMCPDSAQRGED
jgi:hypothetical protein